MKILIVHWDDFVNMRSSQSEHLYSFKNYSNQDCYYLNAQFGIPKYILKIKFDVIIYHYSLLALKFHYPEYLINGLTILKKLSGFKIAVPQDEYINSDYLCKFFKEYGIESILTCIAEDEWEKVYPKAKSGLKYYKRVFTGYIDSSLISKLNNIYKPHQERIFDVGHRARKLPHWYGRFVRLKFIVTNKFLNAPNKHNLKLNLSNNPEDVFFGDDWYYFINDCRVLLGTESGVSLLDTDGSIRKKCKVYLDKFPNATYEEVEHNCFKKEAGNLKLFTIGPRLFQACMTRTCQALVEGEYEGIVKPDIHYIEVKKDWSNIEEVMDKIADKKLCEQIAERAYKDVVLSGKYTYQAFIDEVLLHIKECGGIEEAITNSPKFYLALLKAREKYYPIFSPIKYSLVQIGVLIKKLGINKNKSYIYFRDQIYKLINWFYLTKETNSIDVPRF